MTDTAFIFALALGAVILGGMLWVSHAASFRLSVRQRQRAYAATHSGLADEPELDLGDQPTARESAQGEMRQRVREIAR